MVQIKEIKAVQMGEEDLYTWTEPPRMQLS